MLSNFPPVAGRRSATVAVDDIDAQVARLATVDPGVLPDSELALLVIDMRRLVDATEASWIRLTDSGRPDPPERRGGRGP